MNVRQETVDRIISFVSFDKIKFANQDFILLNKQDKELLLQSFVELKKQYEEKCFGKFNDRAYEEALFWDEFFQTQLKEKTLLYGNSIDDKEVRNNVPSFIKEKLEREPKCAELELGVNVDEVRNKEANETFTLVGNVDQKTLIGTINNHSLMILYKNLDYRSPLLSSKGNSDEATQEFNLQSSYIQANGSQIMQEQSLKRTIASHQVKSQEGVEKF